MNKTKIWIEAVRLHTLPISISGVLAGTACAIIGDKFLLIPAVICLLFAMLAQITANLANDYYDYKNGIDDENRDGFRRVLTIGALTPMEMKIGVIISFTLTSIIGCSLIYYGGWWLLPVGIIIVLCAVAYSAGPYPYLITVLAISLCSFFRSSARYAYLLPARGWLVSVLSFFAYFYRSRSTRC